MTNTEKLELSNRIVQRLSWLREGQSIDMQAFTADIKQLLAAHERAQPASDSEPRFFVDHGVIHDRKRGRHVLGSQRDAETFGEPLQDTVDALNAMESATQSVGGLRFDYLDECRAQAQPASDEEWLKHPQTVKAREQWCAVAKALGADPDDPDAVLKAAQPASVADGLVWTPAMLKAGRIASMEAEAVYDTDRPEGTWKRFGLRDNRVRHIVNAVLAAAPQPPVQAASVADGFFIGGPHATAVVYDLKHTESVIAALCSCTGDDADDYTVTNLSQPPAKDGDR